MKITLGMVIRSFDDPGPVLAFLKNAAKYGHKIHDVIVAYSGTCTGDAAKAVLDEGVGIQTIEIGKDEAMRAEFEKMGMSSEAKEALLVCHTLEKSGLVPYGFNRNTVLMAAYLGNSDVLFFVDSDVKPEVLARENGQLSLKEVDFFGTHLEGLRTGATYSTSDYSGYNILPRAHFDGMAALLRGLQKDKMIEPWRHSMKSDFLAIQHKGAPEMRKAKKALGGNMAIDLRDQTKVLPFFSPIYEVGGETMLARGEDTLLSLAASKDEIRCVDVDMHIFHDTYDDYPLLPDLENKPETQHRFFYACTGWIGRNPFMNYMIGADLERVRAEQEENLAIGTEALVRYTKNERFLILPEAHKAAWDSLPSAVRHYKATVSAWDEFLERRNLK